jgi:hypothetical protein
LRVLEGQVGEKVVLDGDGGLCALNVKFDKLVGDKGLSKWCELLPDDVLIVNLFMVGRCDGDALDNNLAQSMLPDLEIKDLED